MREARVEQRLVDGVNAAGGEVRKLKWLGRRGAPDRLVLWIQHGVHFVELKAPGKKPEPHQAREHKRLRDLAQTVFVLDTIEKVNSYLRHYA